MISLSNYRLIDFGQERKLEAFGDVLVDRPSPSARPSRKTHPQAWGQAHAMFTDQGWNVSTQLPECWQLNCGRFVLPLTLRPFGHVGAFPEQASNWNWLFQQAHTSAIELQRAPKALNLFAYTGGSSLALAAAGSAVSHVDAAKPNVTAARFAATQSQLQDAAIRFLHDDAMTFAQRENRRNQRYEFFVLDPPAYGHGPKGNAWRLERDLWPLLEVLTELASKEVQTHWLITGHTESIQPHQIESWFERLTNRSIDSLESGEMNLVTEGGRTLNAGWFTRCRCRFH